MYKFLWLGISFFVIVIDQLTKTWATDNLLFAQSVILTPFLNFTLLHNTGAAFSFLADAGGWQRWFFMGLAAIISFGLFIWLLRLSAKQMWLGVALALILGGAIGNLIDRTIYGYVIDFIDLYYQQWHWPAFNVADSAISIGVFMLLIEALFFGEKKHD
jgi:signal peptidase II